MDERAQILLKTLVEHYVTDGQPMGSKALLQHSGLGLSPATIRNIMSDLEALGFVSSPHTSAGRIPTQQGYRFFVDSLLSMQPLESKQIKQLESTLSSTDQSELITTAADILSELTQFAGMILIPKRKALVFKHLEFMPLSDKRILLIIVSTDGSVQNRIILSGTPYSASSLTEAGNYFNAHYSGQTFEQARHKLHGDLKKMQADISHLMTAALEEPNLSQSKNKEEQIFIGGESGYSPLDECSMVTSPYQVDGQVVGTLGVIGPTRMAYERVIPIVDITAKLLSNALSNS